MKAIEIDARKANIVTNILTGIHTEEALDALDSLLGKLVGFPCQSTPEQIQARAEDAVSEYENGNYLDSDTIARK